MHQCMDQWVGGEDISRSHELDYFIFLANYWGDYPVTTSFIDDNISWSAMFCSAIGPEYPFGI
jgi:hypothetical protein